MVQDRGKLTMVESFFSKRNSLSYFMTTSTIFSHQTKLFHSFQILSINFNFHTSSFCWRHSHDFIFTAQCDASAVFAVMQCLSVRLSVRLSHSWITSKRINISLKFFHHRVATPF